MKYIKMSSANPISFLLPILVAIFITHVNILVIRGEEVEGKGYMFDIEIYYIISYVVYKIFDCITHDSKEAELDLMLNLVHLAK